VSASLVLARRLSQLRRRPLTSPGGAPLRCLLVADVDLDTGAVVPVPARHPVTEPAQGVHALVWMHGRPIGTVTVLGDADAVLHEVVTRAREELEAEVTGHLLGDALVRPGGLERAREQGLQSVEHPPRPAPRHSVTVAVCTRNRPDALRQCLDALSRLEEPPAELLVVDNASDDDASRRVVEQFPGVRYVREPRPGLDWARNRTLLEARSDVVAFTDDDVLVHPSWVANLRSTFADEPDAVAVTGLVVPAELTTAAQVAFESAGGFGRGYLRRYFAAAVERGEVAARVVGGSGAAGTGANMAFLRAPLLALGGFDPALDVGTVTGGGGDLEMFYRVVAAGHLLVYDPAVVVRHVHRLSMEELERQRRGDGTGSYGFWLGAGARYDAAQRAAFRELSWYWVRRHHVRGMAKALLLRGTPARRLAAAESRGAYAAAREDLYGDAEQRARELRAGFPDEPLLEGPVRPATRPVPPRVADPMVTVDLAEGVDHGSAAHWPDLRGARRVRVQVLRAGAPQAALAVLTRGAGLSPARLRAELVGALGPALLLPGLPRAVVADSPQPAGLRAAPRNAQLLSGLGDQVLTELDPAVPVTVLVATRDRPADLARCLGAICAQESPRAVQVVVVDNSADPTATRALAARHPGVLVVHEPRPGLSRARNAGLPLATGDVVAMTDDDVSVGRDWLERLVAPFADPRVWGVTGNVLPRNLEALEAQVFEDYGGLGRGPHRQVFDRGWLFSGNGPAPTWTIGATANAALRRSALTSLGPFLESLGAGTPAGVGEDTEYFYRVLEAGGVLVYEPTAVVLHTHRETRAGLRKQIFDYSAGHVAYHLEILARYGDARGLRRLAVGQPRYLLSRGRYVARTLDDFPTDLSRDVLSGTLHGPRAWLASRRLARDQQARGVRAGG